MTPLRTGGCEILGCERGRNLSEEGPGVGRSFSMGLLILLDASLNRLTCRDPSDGLDSGDLFSIDLCSASNIILNRFTIKDQL